jgi:hypothetical protein
LWLFPGILLFNNLYSVIKIACFFSPANLIEKHTWHSVLVLYRLPPVGIVEKKMVPGTNVWLWLVSWLGLTLIATMVERALDAHSVLVNLI